MSHRDSHISPASTGLIILGVICLAAAPPLGVAALFVAFMIHVNHRREIRSGLRAKQQKAIDKAVREQLAEARRFCK